MRTRIPIVKSVRSRIPTMVVVTRVPESVTIDFSNWVSTGTFSLIFERDLPIEIFSLDGCHLYVNGQEMLEWEINIAGVVSPQLPIYSGIFVGSPSDIVRFTYDGSNTSWVFADRSRIRYFDITESVT